MPNAIVVIIYFEVLVTTQFIYVIFYVFNIIKEIYVKFVLYVNSGKQIL